MAGRRVKPEWEREKADGSGINVPRRARVPVRGRRAVPDGRRPDHREPRRLAAGDPAGREERSHPDGHVTVGRRDGDDDRQPLSEPLSQLTKTVLG